MPYLFFLGVVPLPITPSALSIKTPSLNKTVTLVNEGEINIPKTAGLREISFEFLLPQVQQYPFANYQLGSYTASVMIPLLNKWKSMMLPFRFIVTRMSPSNKILYFTYIKCLIEDFTYDEDAEAHGLDVMCSINLKEYRDYGTKIFDKKNDENTATVKKTRPTDGKTVKSSVKPQEGDTLQNISKKETGSFDNWKEIAKANDYCVSNNISADVSSQLDANLSNQFSEFGVFDGTDATSILDSMSEHVEITPIADAESAKFDAFMASGGKYKLGLKSLESLGVKSILDTPAPNQVKIPVNGTKYVPDGFGGTYQNFTFYPEWK